MNFDQLAAFLSQEGHKPYRLLQIKQAYFVDLASSWEGVTVLSKELRAQLSERFPWDELTLAHEEEGDGGRTVKFLFETKDKHRIETVLMKHIKRNTVCISSQVGCPMGCAFCATGKLGLTRNLSQEEMVNQVVHVARYLKGCHSREGGNPASAESDSGPDSRLRGNDRGEEGNDKNYLSNLVVMGMGEPFHNYDAVIGALRELNDPKGMAFGARHMSISTCGIVPGILRLAEEPLQVNLAISLHAATEGVRSELMPVNTVYPLEKLMPAVKTYMERTNRKVMFEYLLIDGVNDRIEDADALAQLVKPLARLSHVNLIKYHPTGGDLQATNQVHREAFQTRLLEKGVRATYRITFGEDIDAACGQLAAGQKFVRNSPSSRGNTRGRGERRKSFARGKRKAV